jgi:chromosome segregation ATPase
MNESPREAIARWAEYTQNLLDDLSRMLDTHDQIVGQVQGLEERARAAERRAEAAEQRSASVTERATRLNDDLATMRQEFEDLRRECSRLEASLAPSHPERQPAP